MMRLPFQRPLPSNDALYIQQLLASGGRTRESILLKFGIQQQTSTIMMVRLSNVNSFLNSKWRTAAMLENIRNAITRLPMDRLGRNLGGRMSAMLRLPWQRPLPSNVALNIQQLWASGGRTRESISMKFGTQ